MSLQWNGAAIAARVAAASAEAIDEITEEAAQEAVRDRWWKARRGAEGLVSEVVTEPAKPQDDGTVSGKFGTTQRRGFYGLLLERKQPFLRPAADKTFPGLAGKIRERME